MKSGKVVLALGGICRSKSHHCQTIRRWDSRSSIRSCSCSWYRQIPKEGDKTNGKEERCQTIQDQTFHQSRQLQPLDADSIQRRCCSEQIDREQRCSEGRKQTSPCTNGNQTET